MDHMNDGIRRAVRISLADRNWSQTDLAEKIGVSRQYVSRIMQGQVGKIPPAWQRILEELGLELIAVPKGTGLGSAFSGAFGSGGYGAGAYGSGEKTEDAEPQEEE